MDWSEACRNAVWVLEGPGAVEEADPELTDWQQLWRSVCLAVSDGLPPDDDAEWFWACLAAYAYPVSARDFAHLAKREAYALGREDPFGDPGGVWADMLVTTQDGLVVQWDASLQRWVLPAAGPVDESAWLACLRTFCTAWDGNDESAWERLVLAPLRARAHADGLDERFASFEREARSWSLSERWTYLSPKVSLLTVDELFMRLPDTPMLSCRVEGMGAEFRVSPITWERLIGPIAQLKRELCQQLLAAHAVTIVDGAVHAARIAERPPGYRMPAPDHTLTLRCKLISEGGPIQYAMELTLSGIVKNQVNRGSWRALGGLMHHQTGSLHLRGSLRPGMVIIPSDRGFLPRFLGAARVPGKAFTLSREGDGRSRKALGGRSKLMLLTVDGLDQAEIEELGRLLLAVGMVGVKLGAAVPVKRKARALPAPGDESLRDDRKWMSAVRSSDKQWDRRIMIAEKNLKQKRHNDESER